MSKHRKRWKAEEKLAILEYYKSHGLGATCRKYEVSQTAIYKWRDRYEQEGLDGLQGKTKAGEVDPDVARLERENRELKAIVAEKELQLRIQAEMLKKSR